MNFFGAGFVNPHSAGINGVRSRTIHLIGDKFAAKVTAKQLMASVLAGNRVSAAAAKAAAARKKATASAKKAADALDPAMPLYGISAGYDSQRQSLLYGPPPTAANYGGACMAGAGAGALISLLGPGEVTLGIGTAVGAGIGCVVGLAVEWGQYDNEQLNPALQLVSGYNDVTDVWTRAFQQLDY